MIYKEDRDVLFALLAPSGAQVFSNASGDQTVASLPETGNYTVVAWINEAVTDPVASFEASPTSRT